MPSILKLDQLQSDSGTVTLASNLVFSGASTFVGNIANPTITGTLNLTGGGIKFPATQSSSADANTLDDYEEGTWTPICSTAVTSSNGTYLKIGSVVLFSIQCSITSNASGAAFTLSLPFASSSVNASRAVAWFGYTNGGNATPGNTTWLADAGTAQISAYQNNGTNRTNADFNAALYLSGQFRTA